MKLTWSAWLFLVFMSFICVYYVDGYGYPQQYKPVKDICNIVTIGDIIPRKIPKVVTVDPSCNHGNVEYHYTLSPLDVWFTKRGRYRVCISSNALKDWEHFSISVVTKARCKPVGKPSIGRDVCVDNNYGTMKIRIRHDVNYGPMYMFLIPYKISDLPKKMMKPNNTKVTKMKKGTKMLKKIIKWKTAA